jgi:RNA recognition motif-containing protein
LCECNNLIHFIDGRSKGQGIVVFEKASEAKKAIEELNGTTLSGRQIEVI